MDFLDLTLATPAENLALDDALLAEAEISGEPREILRVWESPLHAVILGRSSRVADEARQDQCRRQGIAILRRSSGGAAVVIGPGCLMYSVVLSYQRRPALAMLDEAHRLVLDRVAEAVRQTVPDVEHLGTSDLAWRGRKFSGNSVRCQRRHLLYHGTLLYAFELDQVPLLLGTPPRQPEYRRQRPHDQFVVNVPTTANELKSALREAWRASSPRTEWPRELVERLVAERYSQVEWNERL